MRWSIALFGFLFACVGDSPNGDAGPLVREEGGPCFSDGTCKTGLVCVVPNKCVQPDAGADVVASDVSQDVQPEAGGGCPTTQLIAWWKGDGNGNDELKSFNLTSQGGTFAQGTIGQAFSLGGTAWFDSDQASQALYPSLGKITVEAWIQPAKVTGGTMIARRTSVGFALYLTNGHIGFTIGSSFATGARTLAVGNWYHVAGTYDQTSLDVYVDGLLDGSTAATLSISSDTAPMRIGARGAGPTSTDGYSGLVDDAAVYQTSLSAADIAAIHSGTFVKCH